MNNENNNTLKQRTWYNCRRINNQYSCRRLWIVLTHYAWEQQPQLRSIADSAVCKRIELIITDYISSCRINAVLKFRKRKAASHTTIITTTITVKLRSLWWRIFKNNNNSNNNNETVELHHSLWRRVSTANLILSSMTLNFRLEPNRSW